MAIALMRLTTGVVYARSISGTLTFVSGGVLALDTGTAAAPSLTFAADPDMGVYLISQGFLGLATGGTGQLGIAGDGLRLQSNGLVGWTPGVITDTTDTILARDAANTLALRNGTNAQKFSVYNTYTSSAVNEYGGFDWTVNTNELYIGTQKTGAGTARGIAFGVGGTRNWKINTDGHLILNADNTYDIGASEATRPRTAYLATSLFVGATAVVGAQGAAVANASGGTVVDVEARAALNALLARLRTHGLIAT